jgi:hypothetical protein
MAENFRPIAALPVDRPIQEKFLKYLFAVVVAVLTSTVAVASTDGSFKPKAGFVPDALTATAIAEAVLSPIYGRNSIVKQKPYNVSLKDEVWTVEGTLSKDRLGGTFAVRIAKDSGAILHVSHSK